MSVIRTEYIDDYGTHPWNFYCDDTIYSNIAKSSSTTALSARVVSADMARDYIASVCGSAILSNPVPLIRTGYSDVDGIMELIKAMFPNSYYVDTADFDNQNHYEQMTVSGNNTTFKLHQKLYTFEYGGNTHIAGQCGSFSMTSDGGIIMGLGVRFTFNSRYKGEFNMVIAPVVNTTYFDEETLTYQNIPSSGGTGTRAGMGIRWYTQSGSTPNFWIYTGQTINNPHNFNGFTIIERPEPSPDSDPYDPSGDGSGYSGTGGGPAPTGGTGTTGNGGLHDDTSDPIPTPNTPSDVVISSGLFTAYNPDASQLSSFANALWNMQVSDINDVLRFLFGGDAFNAIIGMHLLPVAPSVSGSQNIKLGNWDTGVSAPKISSQYVQVPFGSVLLPEYWGNCIDYAPYTRVQLALPYIGMVDVDTDDVLGSTNTLTYNIDVLSGALCAMLHCVKGNLTSVIYQWSGSCAVDLPITGANKNAIIGAIGASGVVTSMAFSAAGGGLLGGLAASAALAGSAASAYGTAKGKVQKNGNFGSHAGALGIMTPYFIVSRPVQSVPTSWQADKGYPANISAQLSTVLGYTEVSEINLECSGTEAEKEEIIRLLKSGVIF